MRDLFTYEEYCSNWLDYPQIELGFKSVPVDKIVGSSSAISGRYYEDFSPKPEEQNDRYTRLTEEIQDQLTRKQKLELGLIHLFKFKFKNVIWYFVGMDGNRRVSNCKRLKIKTIRAEVTEVNLSSVMCQRKS